MVSPFSKMDDVTPWTNGGTERFHIERYFVLVIVERVRLNQCVSSNQMCWKGEGVIVIFIDLPSTN